MIGRQTRGASSLHGVTWVDEAWVDETSVDKTWVDAEAFRALFRAVPAAVSIVGLHSDGEIHATTVSSFCSLSLQPALLMLALNQDSSILARMSDQGAFGLSVLAHDQEDLAQRCAQRGSGALPTQYWDPQAPLPRLRGSIAWAGCAVDQVVPGGDHRIVIARVTYAEVAEGAPLIHHARGYHTIAKP